VEKPKKGDRRFPFLQVISDYFTPDPKNTKSLSLETGFRFLHVALKVRFAASVQLYTREKKHFISRYLYNSTMWYCIRWMFPNLLFSHGSGNAKGQAPMTWRRKLISCPINSSRLSVSLSLLRRVFIRISKIKSRKPKQHPGLAPTSAQPWLLHL
jgi:hypothetical protein